MSYGDKLRETLREQRFGAKTIVTRQEEVNKKCQSINLAVSAVHRQPGSG